MTDYLTKAEVQAEVIRCYALAGCPELLHRTTIRIDLGGFRGMGKCSYNSALGSVTLRFSKKLWPALPVAERLDTIRHEVAHAIDFNRRKTSDHGSQWRAIARLVGAKPERGITDSEMGAEALKIAHAARMRRGGGACPAHCPCGKITEITAKVAVKITNGSTFRCRTCHKPIVLGKPVVKAPAAKPAVSFLDVVKAAVAETVKPLPPVKLPTLVEQAKARCAKVGCTVTENGAAKLQALVATHKGQTMKVKIEVRSTTMPEAGTFEVEYTLEVR